MYKKSQHQVIYILIIVVISFVMMGGVWFLSNNLRETGSRNIGGYIADAILAKLESAVIEIKTVASLAEEQEITRRVKLPDRIGNQNYQLTGSGRKLKLQTIGDPSITREKTITSWNATLAGTVSGGKGEVELYYSVLTHQITLK